MRPQGLVKRGNRYYFRVRVPHDLRSIYTNTREIKVSLHTADENVARIRVLEEALQVARDFETARRTKTDFLPRSAVWRISPDELGARIARRSKDLTELHSIDDVFINRFCCTYLREGLDEESDRRANPLIGGSMHVDLGAALRRGRLDELRAMRKTGDAAMIRDELAYFLAEQKFRIVGQPAGYRKLLDRFVATVIREQELLNERDAGQTFDIEAIAPLSRCLPKPSSKQHGDMKISKLVDHWKSLTKPRIKTIDEYGSIAADFAVFFSEKLKVTQLALLSKRDVVAYRDQLLERKLHPKTVQKKIGALNTLFSRAVNDSMLDNNPCAGVQVPQPDDEKERTIFGAADLRVIFSSDIYKAGIRPKGCGGEAAKWVALIGLFTGMRIEEICQLRIRDVMRDAALGWYIRVDNDDGKTIKNKWARRNIPVHTQLVRCGFLDFVNTAHELNPKLLFPALSIDKYKRHSSMFSKKWNKHLRKTLAIEQGDNTRSFHSFRHTFKHQCRESRIPEDIHDAFTGHRPADSKVSRGYGDKTYPMSPLFDEMQRFSIKDLDLSHLWLREPVGKALAVG
jgi:integrase